MINKRNKQDRTQINAMKDFICVKFKNRKTIYGVKSQKAGGVVGKRSRKWNSWNDLKVLPFWSGF